jgi:putative tributyrin esterase
MALFDIQFFSETLGVQTGITAIIPQDKEAGPRHLWPTLYLLHGLSDNHSAWTRWTSIERYADEHGIAVVMATTARGFYVDAVTGYPYGTFFSRELPAFCRSYLPLSPRWEDTFVAGLSMGGYGSFSLALNNPGMFAAAGSFSGALDMAHRMEAPDFDPGSPFTRELELIFGKLDEMAGGRYDLFALLKNAVASRTALPRLYQCCGTEDFLYAANTRFRDHARGLGVDLTYEEEPAVHEWGYWDRSIQRFLSWLRLKTDR